jgi:hypothetical protein
MFRRPLPRLLSTSTIGRRSTATKGRSRVLTRDFIHNALYEPTNGYFARGGGEAAVGLGGGVIASLAKPINFGDLFGEMEWRHTVKNLYDASPRGWLTPVEVFAPYYSHALARYLLRSRDASHHPLVVYEIGGGTGINARHILDYIRETAPKVYKEMSYTIFEISSSLRLVQEKALSVHSAVARSVLADGTRLSDGMSSNDKEGYHHSGQRPAPKNTRGYDERPCFVLGMEVLDNLPHDKVVSLGAPDLSWGQSDGLYENESHIKEKSSTSFLRDADGNYLHETWVERVPTESASRNDGKQVFRERYSPLTDPLIIQAYEAHLSVENDRHVVESTPAAKAQKSFRSFIHSFGKRVGLVDRHLPPIPPQYKYGHYLPTGSLRMLTSLKAALPRHRLVLADFDLLPPPSVKKETVMKDNSVLCYAEGSGPPIVASKDPVSREWW